MYPAGNVSTAGLFSSGNAAFDLNFQMVFSKDFDVEQWYRWRESEDNDYITSDSDSDSNTDTDRQITLLQRLTRKKKKVREYSREKKMRKVARFSRCYGDKKDCKCVGWDRSETKFDEDNKLVDMLCKCKHGLEEHTENLIDRSDSDVDMLINIVVDVITVINFISNEDSDCMRDIYIYIYHVLRHGIIDCQQPFVDEPLWGQPPFEESTVNMMISKLLLTQFPILSHEEWMVLYDVASVFTGALNEMHLPSPHEPDEQTVIEDHSNYSYFLDHTRWFVFCKLPTYCDSLEVFELCTVFGRRLLRPIFRHIQNQILDKLFKERYRMPDFRRKGMLQQMPDFLDLMERELFDENSVVWDKDYEMITSVEEEAMMQALIVQLGIEMCDRHTLFNLAKYIRIEKTTKAKDTCITTTITTCEQKQEQFKTLSEQLPPSSPSPPTRPESPPPPPSPPSVLSMLELVPPPSPPLPLSSPTISSPTSHNSEEFSLAVEPPATPLSSPPPAIEDDSVSLLAPSSPTESQQLSFNEAPQSYNNSNPLMLNAEMEVPSTSPPPETGGSCPPRAQPSFTPSPPSSMDPPTPLSQIAASITLPPESVPLFWEDLVHYRDSPPVDEATTVDAPLSTSPPPPPWDSAGESSPLWDSLSLPSLPSPWLTVSGEDSAGATTTPGSATNIDDTERCLADFCLDDNDYGSAVGTSYLVRNILGEEDLSQCVQPSDVLPCNMEHNVASTTAYVPGVATNTTTTTTSSILFANQVNRNNPSISCDEFYVNNALSSQQALNSNSSGNSTAKSGPTASTTINHTIHHHTIHTINSINYCNNQPLQPSSTTTAIQNRHYNQLRSIRRRIVMIRKPVVTAMQLRKVKTAVAKLKAPLRKLQHLQLKSLIFNKKDRITKRLLSNMQLSSPKTTKQLNCTLRLRAIWPMYYNHFRPAPNDIPMEKIYEIMAILDKPKRMTGAEMIFVDEVAVVDDLAKSEESRNIIEMHLLANTSSKDLPPQISKWFIELRNLFSYQLPRMPVDYITRLLFDCKHKTIAMVKNDYPIGGICFRPFEEQGFSEIVFCAVTFDSQMKGYGTHLMNHLKDYHVRIGIKHLLTYADQFATGYFERLGFCKSIRLDRSAYQGYIKEYEGAILMHCELDGHIRYVHFAAVARRQHRIVEYLHEQEKAKELEESKKRKGHVEQVKTPKIYPGITLFRQGVRSIPIASIPGIEKTSWRPVTRSTRGRRTLEEPQSVTVLTGMLRNVLNSIKTHPDSYEFRQPVSKEDVPDYYDHIRFPMDLRTMTERLDAGYYVNRRLFTADMMRIFRNCKTYNSPTTEYYYCATTLEHYFKTKMRELGLWDDR